MNALGMWEGRLLLWIQENLRCEWLNPVVKAITSLGNEGIFWIVLVLVLMIFKKTRKVGVCCAVGLLATFIVVNLALKPIFARTRPYVLLEGLEILVGRPGDHSFPSGHSAHALAVTWGIFRTTKKKYGVPMLVLGVLVALSRLYVGVHFPTDVIAGGLVGMILTEISVRIFRKCKFGTKA